MDASSIEMGARVIFTDGPYKGVYGKVVYAMNAKSLDRVQVEVEGGPSDGHKLLWSVAEWTEPFLETISGPPERAERQVQCEHCGSGDELVLMDTVVAQVVIGMREDGSFIPDGGPEHYEVDHGQGQVIWCGACQLVVHPIPAEDEEEPEEAPEPERCNEVNPLNSQVHCAKPLGHGETDPPDLIHEYTAPISWKWPTKPSVTTAPCGGPLGCEGGEEGCRVNHYPG